jgi:tetratricopeptide (TPR) repeat protein
LLNEAEEGYRAHLAEHPRDAAALHLLGVICAERGNVTEALDLAQRAHAEAPERPDILLTLATLHFRSGDADRARQFYEQALVLDPNMAKAHTALGHFAAQAGERERAEQHFRTALRAEEDPQALAGLGALELSAGNPDAALGHLGRAAELSPDNAQVQVLLARVFLQRGTSAFAEKALDNALRLDPANHQARGMLADLLMDAGRAAEAEPHFAALLGAESTAAIGELGLADAARMQDRLEEAMQRYDAALQRDPHQPRVVQALAWCLLKRNRGNDAMEVYDAYLQHAPDDIGVATSRAELLRMSGRLADAVEAWQLVLDRDPSNVLGMQRLAWLHEHLGQFDAARDHAEQAAEHIDDPEMTLVRIRAALREGRISHARVLLDGLGERPLSVGQARLRSSYEGHLRDRAGDAAGAVAAFSASQEGMPSAWPDLPAPFVVAPVEAPAEPLDHAPVLLLGTPGSGVERVAALLADQPRLAVLRDRIFGSQRADDFRDPDFVRYAEDLDEQAIAALRDRYYAPLRALDVPEDRTIVDWLPHWDARFLPFVRQVLPGARLVIVERDPRDALLNWLAFGWSPEYSCTDVGAAADWLARANRHLRAEADAADPPRLVVAADALLDDPASAAGFQLAQFLGLEPLVAGKRFEEMMQGLGGTPVRFPPGHWQAYADALAAPFATLAADA